MIFLKQSLIRVDKFSCVTSSVPFLNFAAVGNERKNVAQHFFFGGLGVFGPYIIHNTFEAPYIASLWLQTGIYIYLPSSGMRIYPEYL